MLYIPGMIFMCLGSVFSDVANFSPDFWAWLSCDVAVILLVNWCSVVSWRFTWDSILQFACHLSTFLKNFGRKFFKLYYFFFLITTWWQIINIYTCSNLFSNHNFYERLGIFKYALLGLLLMQKVYKILKFQFGWCLDFWSNENELHQDQTLEFLFGEILSGISIYSIWFKSITYQDVPHDNM